MALPLAMIPALRQAFIGNDGFPLAAGVLSFFETDGSTPKTCYSDQNGTPLGTTVTLDSNGIPVQIYLAASGYTVKIYNSAAVLQRTITFCEDVGSAFLADQGTIQATGTSATVSPFTIPDASNCVPIHFSGSGTVQLPTAASRWTAILIINYTTSTQTVARNGSDTINTVAGNFTMAAASSPSFPALLLLPDGVSNWIVQSYSNVP